MEFINAINICVSKQLLTTTLKIFINAEISKSCEVCGRKLGHGLNLPTHGEVLSSSPEAFVLKRDRVHPTFVSP